MLKMMIHFESAMSKKNPSTTSYQVAMVFDLQNISNAMITSVNTFMFSCYWSTDLSSNAYHGTNTNQHKQLKITQQKSCQTDHKVISNKPDITVVDKINKKANLIEVAVPNDYNICNKCLQEIRAYTNLSREIKTLWNLNKVQITPIIAGFMETFYNKFDDDISKPGLTNHNFGAEELVLLISLEVFQKQSIFTYDQTPIKHS